MTRTSGNSRAIISAVPSLLALSTTMISANGRVCARSERRFSRTSSFLFQVETTALARGSSFTGRRASRERTSGLLPDLDVRVEQGMDVLEHDPRAVDVVGFRHPFGVRQVEG